MMVTYWLQTLRSNTIVCNLINTWVELWPNFEMTKPHTSPSRASYVVSVATPSDENGRKIPEVHCVWIGYLCHGQGIFIGTHSPVRIKLIGVSSWANKYTNSKKSGITYTKLYWCEFGRYLLVPVLRFRCSGMARMCKQNFTTQPRHYSATWSATSVGAWWSEESDHCPGRQTVDLNGHGQLLHLGSSPASRGDPPIWEEVVSSEDCKQTSGYWLRRPDRCPRLTLNPRRRHRVCGRTHRSWDHRHWKHCVFSTESRFTLFHNDGRDRVRCRQGVRLIYACAQPTGHNRGPAVMVWGYPPWWRRMDWLCGLEPSTANATSGFSGIVRYPGQRFRAKLYF